MARKRITEQDLIDFNARMDELSDIVEEKYNKIDAEKAPQTPEIKQVGVLLLKRDEDLIDRITSENIACEVFDIDRSLINDSNTVTPAWSRVIGAANSAFENINAKQIYVYAPEQMLPAGLLVAAQYEVKALFSHNGRLSFRIPVFFGKARILRKIASVSKKNLFLVTAPVYVSGKYSSNIVDFLNKRVRSEETITIEGVPADYIPKMIRQISNV